MCINSGTPNIGYVGQDYSNLVNQFAGGIPTQLSTEQQFKPGFVNTELAANNQSLFGGRNTPGLLEQFQGAVGPLADSQNYANTLAARGSVNTVDTLGQSAAAAIGNVNPGQTALTRELTSTAATQLAAGSQLAPSDINRIDRQVRGDWASRGLGDSAPGQLGEAVNMEVAGQNLLNQREAAASNAIGINQNNITLPALGLATQQSNATGQAQQFMGSANNFQQNAQSSLIPTSELSDVLSTVYNARAASQITDANNKASLIGSALSY